MTDNLSELAEAYVRTVNQGDAAGYLEIFDEDALVDDAGRQFRGRAEIKKWSDSDIFAAEVTFELLNHTEQDGETELTTKVDGNFDRTGLPNPVIIVHRLRIADKKIVSLTCQLG